MLYFWQFKDHNLGRKKRKLGKWPHSFIYFLSSNCDIHFCIWKFSSTFWALTVISIFVFENCQNSFSSGSLPPLRPFLVCKVPEFWWWKFWDQNFVQFDSGNIHIKESKKPGLTFFIELWTKFVWSYGLFMKTTTCLQNFY